jgi:FkbM family methyltransferase
MNKLFGPIRQIVRRFGWDVVRYNPFTNVNLRRQALLDRLRIECVLDIGANVGDYAAALRAFGYRESIVSIEPTRAAFAALEARRQRDPRWSAKRLAVAGSAGECVIHVAANSVSSSLLPRSARLAESCPESSYVHSETVESVPLADLLLETGSPPRRVWAKLDVQGSLGDIIGSAEGSLKGVSALEVELPFVRMYDGEGLFAELLTRLQHDGFELVSLESNTFDRRRGAVLEVNAMLVHSCAPGWV